MMMISAIFWGIAVPAAVLALLDWWGRRKDRQSNEHR
jgi:hypothetical protein